MGGQGQQAHLAAGPGEARVLEPAGARLQGIPEEGLGAEGRLVGLADVLPLRPPAPQGAQ